MADNVKVEEGKGPTISTDEVGGVQVQRVKVQHGADGSATDVSTASPLPVDDDASQVILSAIKALLEGTAVVKVTDNAGSLTVDAPLATPVAVRISDGSEGIGTTAEQLHVDDGGSSLSVDDNGSTLSVDDGGSSLTVDGSVSVGAALPAGNNNIGDVDVASLPALPAGSNNIGQTDPRGNKAHDEVDAGNPIKTGARARTALPAAVAQDDRADSISDKFSRLLGTTAPLDQRVSGSIDLTDTTSTTVIAAPGESQAIVVTDIEVSNGDPTVGTFVELFDEATKKWKGFAGALGGGFSQSNPDGLFVVTANKPVKAKCLTTSSETSVNISGYKIPA